MNSLLHLRDQILQLLNLLVSKLFLGVFLSAIVALFIEFVLQALDLISELGCFVLLSVKFGLDYALSIVLESFLLVDSLSFKTLSSQLGLEISDLLL